MATQSLEQSTTTDKSNFLKRAMLGNVTFSLTSASAAIVAGG